MRENSVNKEKFIDSVEDGKTDKVKDLLAHDSLLASQINKPWFSFDAPAVVYAAGGGNREMIDVLLDAGADINIKSSWWAGGVSALNHATGSMLRYDRDLAAYLIKRGAVIDAHAAAGLDMPNKLEELLGENPNVVNERGGDGMTPLHFAATPRIAGLLLEHGADINIQDIDHHGTATQWTMSSRPDVSRYLVEQGTETDIVLYCAMGDVERTLATLQSNSDLLEARADGKAPGGYVYFYTVGRGMNLLEIALQFNHLEIVGVLLEAGYQIKLKEWYQIVGQGRQKMDALVKRFLAHGWDINGRQQHRRGLWSPLHWIAQRGLTPGLACLLSNGANPNIADDKERTPLHIIASKGIGKNQVNLLIEHGADMNVRDDMGRTPRDYAEEASRDAVARLLAELGAEQGK